ncbi:NAD(P)H-dependent glycerol-3-phosphate dehydrogenase [Anaplasma bovis]|uniref:NAD(P)H-dependent glycerol-3-phosphate dehydrogenase n=1 Tax=Anaplasma bovis TaxID=186733 RepID=UPI002FF27D02
MHVAVLGAGAFGTAMSIALSNAEHSVTLWSRSETFAESLRTRGENTKYLPGYFLPKTIEITTDLEKVLRRSSALLLCVPTQELRNLCVCMQEAKALSPDVSILICSKGIENASLKLPSEVIEEFFPQNSVFVLSGPAFATEIAGSLPCAMVLAGNNKEQEISLASELSSATMRLTPHDDYMGVQICAALKNVVAIACGIVLGRNLGNNAAATVLTKGLREIRDLCIAKTGSAEPETLMGLPGLGDLVLTCTTPNSRNMSFGLKIGKNPDPLPFHSKGDSTVLVEGAASALSAHLLGNALGINLPICAAVSGLLTGRCDTEQALQEILAP